MVSSNQSNLAQSTLLSSALRPRYPEQKLKFVGDGYQFDPKRGVGIAGYRGRHILMHDKCTGCQLCAIACEGIAEAIGMVKVDEQWKHNKKGIMPQIDYGSACFAAFVGCMPLLCTLYDK